MKSYALTVFYDGGCPLCRREIDHYRKLKAKSAIQWIDVTDPDAPLADFGLEREAAMRRFHVLDAGGHFHVGAHGFVRLWADLPYYRYLSTLVRGLSVVPLLDRVYVRFADWHFGRRCVDGVCVTVPEDKPL
ncbi:MAG: hypothetical protein RL333_1558 [Pseudomonadota bacterium]|jgi:predicted DCC family thiol-disulfide oxidoreductase YuxK